MAPPGSDRCPVGIFMKDFHSTETFHMITLGKLKNWIILC